MTVHKKKLHELHKSPSTMRKLNQRVEVAGKGTSWKVAIWKTKKYVGE
jgi:hypothetical protein